MNSRGAAFVSPLFFVLAPSGADMNLRSKIPLFILLSLIGAVVFFLFVLPSMRTTSPRSPMNVNLMRAKGLATACRDYAVDHEGHSPSTLAELDTQEDLRYRDPKSGKRMDWLYFPISDLVDAPATRILLASPIPYKDQRIVSYADSSTRFVKNKDLEAQLPEHPTE